MTVIAFNTLAVRAGLLVEQHRPRTKSAAMKRYLSVTEAGLQFAKNVVSPSNPRETSPHWYGSSFGDVLALLKEGGAA